MKAMIGMTAAVLALAVGAGTAAAATEGAPWITARSAATELYNYDIDFSDGTSATVLDATCYGYGRHIRNRYRHFQCYVESEEYDPMWVRVDSSWGLNDVEFIDWAD
jgi:hypothetical protein